MLTPFWGNVLLTPSSSPGTKLTLVSELSRILLTTSAIHQAAVAVAGAPSQAPEVNLTTVTIVPVLTCLLSLLPHCSVTATTAGGGAKADAELVFVLQVKHDRVKCARMRVLFFGI